MECHITPMGTGRKEFLWCTTHATPIISFQPNSFPYGVDWKKVKEAIEKHKRKYA